MNLLKFLWGCSLLMIVMLPSCTESDDTKDLSSVDASTQKVSSITTFGQTFASFQYDGQGRMTQMRVIDAMSMSISYSPLRVVLTYEDDEIDEWIDIKTNNAGYITSATARTEYGGETETWPIRIEYNSKNQLISINSDGDTDITIDWNGGDPSVLSMGDYSQSLNYLDTENKAKNVSLNWCEMSPYWITGLFGEIPSHLPKSTVDSYNESVGFAYKLNDNGSIAVEQVLYEGYGQTYTVECKYNYLSTRTIDFTDSLRGNLSGNKRQKTINKRKLFVRK